MTNIKRTSIYLITFILICLAILFVLWSYIAPKFKYQPPVTKVASALKPTKPLNSFHLVDVNGKEFTEKSLRGHWTLIFFGYTRCPDICPKTLGIVRDSWNLFTTSHTPIPVRFVFADISRTPIANDELKAFLENYHQDFMGVIGTPDQMHRLSDQLGIYAQQTPDKIDHTAALMLIDPQGRLNAIFTPPFSALDIMHDLTVLTL